MKFADWTNCGNMWIRIVRLPMSNGFMLILRGMRVCEV